MMFRELRRQDRKMEDQAARELLAKEEYGVLATVDAEGYPYGVPLSYAFDEKSNAIYFHCAREGHKLDNIAFNSKASFSVVGEALTLPDKFSVRFQSVIVFGRIVELNEEEKREGLRAILMKYSSDFMDKGLKYLVADEAQTRVLKLEIEHFTGKERFS